MKSPTTTRNRQTQFISTFPPSSLSEVDLLPDVVFFNLSGRVMWYDQASTTTILQSLARRLLRRLCASTALCLRIVTVQCAGRPAGVSCVSRMLNLFPSCRSAFIRTIHSGIRRLFWHTRSRLLPRSMKQFMPHRQLYLLRKLSSRTMAPATMFYSRMPCASTGF